MKLFFDNTFGPRAGRSFVELLSGDHAVEYLRGRFPAETADAVWLTQLMREGEWVVFTHDRNIQRKDDYLVQACRKSDLVVVFLARAWSHMPLLQHHGKLLMRMQTLLSDVAKSRPGTILQFGPSGGLKRV